MAEKVVNVIFAKHVAAGGGDLEISVRVQSVGPF